MTMMVSIYCPVCFKNGKHKESIQTRLAITVDDICTDSIFDLDGRIGTPRLMNSSNEYMRRV